MHDGQSIMDYQKMFNLVLQNITKIKDSNNEEKELVVINPLDTGLKCFISIILLGLALAEFWS